MIDLKYPPWPKAYLDGAYSTIDLTDLVGVYHERAWKWIRYQDAVKLQRLGWPSVYDFPEWMPA